MPFEYFRRGSRNYVGCISSLSLKALKISQSIFSGNKLIKEVGIYVFIPLFFAVGPIEIVSFSFVQFP